MYRFCRSATSVFALVLASALCGRAHAQTPPMTPDIPAKFIPPHNGYDYVKREVMIPMRDGVKLYTVIAVPKGANHAPIVLTRTPYDAASRMKVVESPYLAAEVYGGRRCVG